MPSSQVFDMRQAVFQPPLVEGLLGGNESSLEMGVEDGRSMGVFYEVSKSERALGIRCEIGEEGSIVDWLSSQVEGSVEWKRWRTRA